MVDVSNVAYEDEKLAETFFSNKTAFLNTFATLIPLSLLTLSWLKSIWISHSLLRKRGFGGL